MLRAFGLGAILFGFWLALSGHYTPLILSFGVGSCVLVVFLSVRMNLVDREGAPFHIAGRLLLYLPWLLKEIFVSNLQVARAILDPKLPISPRMVLFHGTQQTDLGRTIFANSITLTPGTVTTGVEGQDFEVHALLGDGFQSGDEQAMDRRCTWVEGG